MDTNELKSSIKTSKLMLEEIYDNASNKSQDQTNQALLSVSSYINNIILKNEGYQLDIFNINIAQEE